jgi:hypothetical protein
MQARKTSIYACMEIFIAIYVFMENIHDLLIS